MATEITVEEDEDGRFSKLFISTVDRPGLLVEIVRVLKDISVNVISAEVTPPPSLFISAVVWPALHMNAHVPKECQRRLHLRSGACRRRPQDCVSFETPGLDPRLKC